MEDRVEYRVLGKVEVLRDGEPVDLGSYRQRALMALLLTTPNTVVSTDRIIDGLWGDTVGDRQNALWVYVSGLRKALEPDREKRSEGTILLTRAPGYLVQVAADELDAGRFERLLAEGRSLTDTDPAAASLVLGEALALWRGRPFEEFAYESFAHSAITRLEGLRLEAVEARIDADLLRGMSRELVSELESLVREHPLQERLTGQLMLALYRSGRQADSLRAYQRLRARLGEELGIEPGADTRRLEERIVTGDASLEGATRTRVAGPQPGLAVRGYELRGRLGERGAGVIHRAFQPSVGREVAIKVIRAELANDPGFIRRFEAEAQLVARLEHPHVVPLYDYWREPDAAYLVMRFMRGGSLAERIERGALTGEQASLLAEQIGGALHAAHRVGVVHREVTTANILIDDDGNAYLSDFLIAGADDTTTATDIAGLAAVMAEAITGLTGRVAQIRGALPAAVRSVVDRATGEGPGVGHEGAYADVAAFVADLRDALGAPPVDEVVLVDVGNPYKGLRAFDGADAGDFFGRERLVERLLARLGEPTSRFVAVVGPSGSGKSSVVRAGLLPAVREGGLPGDWFTVMMAPAPHPFEALEEALLGVAIDPPTSLLEELVYGDVGIGRAARRVLPDDGSRLLLVVDQFEELFTQVDPETADRFIAALVDACTDEHGRVSVVATLRADFYDRPLRHRALGELLRDGTEVITPMTPDELDRAITAPAERLGIEFERALVTELVHDVVDRSGALPLLQYTLTELFDDRRGNRIPHAAYRELGGVSGALAKRAEGLYAGLGDEAHEVARQVFLRLVTLGEGTDDTRRRALRSELEQLAVDRRFLDGVLETFGRHRLLSFDRDPVTRGPTVEISHEALLTEWVRLREWIDGARHDVRNQRRLAEAMADWSAAGGSDEYLLRGGRLQQLEGWASTASLPLSEPERAYLEASVRERERTVTEEREREQRTQDAERRERQRARQLVAAVAVGAVISLLAGFGMWQWRSATAAQREIEGLRVVNSLVSASTVVLGDDPNLALLLARQAVLESGDLGFVPESAVDAVQWALQSVGARFDVAPDTPVAVRPGPRGSTAVWALPPAELVAVADRARSRGLTLQECVPFYGEMCPELEPIPSDLPIEGGMEAYGATPPDAPGALAGSRIALAAAFLVNEPGFEHELDAFEEATGIRVSVTRYGGNDLPRLATGAIGRPDVYVGPGPLPPWVLREAIDLGRFLDHETLRADFGDVLLNTARLTSLTQQALRNVQAIAVPIDLDLGGMVYYPKAAFDAAGYEVPATWDELMALSRRIVEDGRTPWCVGFRNGNEFDGWPGADLIETLVLRSAGLDAYDAWASGDLGFGSPEVTEAGRLAEELVFGDGFLAGSPAAIADRFWDAQLLPMVADDPESGQPPPTCWLVHQRDIMFRIYFGGGGDGLAEMGVDVDYFLLPPVDADAPFSAIGMTTFAAGLADRPEVRLLLEHLASPEFGTLWAAEDRPFEETNIGPTGTGYIPPNRRFDTAAFGPAGDAEVAVHLRMVADLRRAVDAGTMRPHAVDVMPVGAGGLAEGRPLLVNEGMVDWVAGVRTLDEVFADLDDAADLGRVKGF